MSHPGKMTKISLPLAAPLEGGIGDIAWTCGQMEMSLFSGGGGLGSAPCIGRTVNDQNLAGGLQAPGMTILPLLGAATLGSSQVFCRRLSLESCRKTEGFM